MQEFYIVVSTGFEYSSLCHTHQNLPLLLPSLQSSPSSQFHTILMLPFCSKLCHHGYGVSHRSCVVSWGSCFPLSSINSATTFLISPSTCSSGEITGTETPPQPTVRVYQHPHLRSSFSGQAKQNVGQDLPSHWLHPSCPSSAGMTVEMVAMLLASVIQGQVVAVYNAEKQEACQHLDHETPESTSSPQIAFLQETVDTALKMLNQSAQSSWALVFL